MTTCLSCGHADAAGFLYCPRCGTKAVEAAESKDPLLGRILNGKYRIESQLGQGAMGTVYLGEHLGLRKKVALKLLHPDLQVSDDSLARFQREGMAAGRFNHPHAIQIFDFDKSEGRIFYLAMEYVEGMDLGLFLRQKGRLPVAQAVKLMRQIVSCLAEAHRHGIVHRDLKPDNIMVSEGSRQELRIKVLDFGLSKLVDRRMGSSLVTQPGRLLGTPLYMAPEQVAGDEADERSDIYAAGLILYEMLAGERPFKERDSTHLFLSRPVAEAPSIRANVPELDVPDELEELLLRALQRERDARFQTAEELLNALDELPFVAGASTPGGKAAVPVRPPSIAKTVRTPVAAPAPAPPAPEARGSGFPRGAVVAAFALLLVVALAWLFAPGLLSGAAESTTWTLVRAQAAAKRSDEERRYLALLDEARLKLTQGDPAGALASAQAADLFACRDAELFHVRGEARRAAGELDTARTDFETATRAAPDYLEPYLGLFRVHFERGDVELAQAALERAAELAPEEAEVLAARGTLAWKRGDAAAALSAFEAALVADPGCADAHLYLGRVRLDAGENEAALAALTAAKTHAPAALQPHLWLAEAYFAGGKLELADTALEEAVRLQPDSVEARVQRGAFLLERESRQALEFLDESTERLPQAGRLWVLKAIALEASGDVASAVGAFQRAFEHGVRDPEARCLYGTLLQQEGRVEQAIAQYELVLTETGDFPAANLNYGLALFGQEKYEEAAARFQRALDFDDESLLAHFHLAILCKDYLDEAERARTHLERYQALGGTDPRVVEWLDEL
jgi:serine/threonine-protein kinase